MGLQKLFQRDKILVYPIYISALSLTSDIKNITGKAVGEIFVIVEKGKTFFYMDYDSVSNNCKKLCERILNVSDFYEEAKSKIKMLLADLLSYCENIQTDYTQKSDEELYEYLDNYVEKLLTTRSWGAIPELIDSDENLTRFLQKGLRDHLLMEGIRSEEEQSSYYSLLSSSEEMSETQEEELCRLKMLDKLKKISSEIIDLIIKKDIEGLKKEFPKAYDLFENHLKTFSYLTYANNGPAMSYENLSELVKNSVENGNFIKQKKEIVKHFENIKKEKLVLLKKLALPKDLVRGFRISSELMIIKNHRKGVYQKSYLLMDKIMEEIAERLGLTLRAIKFFSHSHHT